MSTAGAVYLTGAWMVIAFHGQWWVAVLLSGIAFLQALFDYARKVILE